MLSYMCAINGYFAFLPFRRAFIDSICIAPQVLYKAHRRRRSVAQNKTQNKIVFLVVLVFVAVDIIEGQGDKRTLSVLSHSFFNLYMQYLR